MNLIIDVGNSFVKLAVFQSDVLKFKEKVALDLMNDTVSKLKAKYPKIKDAIISSVNNLPEEDTHILAQYFRVLTVTAKTKLPFKNRYETPTTLGVDRLALISAAVQQYPKKNALVIDAGTCVTYDFIDANNTYYGGAISPGLSMRYKALNNLTANLPLLHPEVPKSFIGMSTAQAIHSGVVNGLVNEIDGVINQYIQEYTDLTVILTGGDANFLSKQLKSSIFANSNFLLEGLNYILKYNSI